MRRRSLLGFLAGLSLLDKAVRRYGGKAVSNRLLTPVIEPFPLNRVRLLPGPILDASRSTSHDLDPTHRPAAGVRDLRAGAQRDTGAVLSAVR
jgi:hypothetical protein